MNFENLVLSFSQSGQYEAAGTVWMLDHITQSPGDAISMTQLDSATWMWSPEAFALSSTQPLARRFSFDVPLPVQVLDVNVAQRLEQGNSAVVMAQALPMLAGRALVIAWYGAMGDALTNTDEDRVFKLFEAANSVPIRLRLCPDVDSRQLVSLL